MDTTEARQLILEEGIGSDGIVVLFRMGEDPGPDRMARVVEAIRVVFDDLSGAETLDRQLAYALFGLGTYTESQVSSWIRAGRTWRDDFTAMELPALLMAVESIFADEWADPMADP